MTDIALGRFVVGPGHRPFIVAEMSGNHNQSLERALAIIDAAADTGVHAVKLQTYRADTMTLDMDAGEFSIRDTESLWAGKSLHALYEEAHTPWEWHAPLFDRARERGLLCFSTPFDETAVDFLETLGVPCYKIASFENVHLPLIRKVASTGKPMILSTGMATLAELDEAVGAARQAGCRELILLKCTSSYPATPEGTNILTIPHLAQLFDCPVGLSDHSMGVGVAVGAVALGARMIEKHFTIRRADGGVDAAFSLEPAEMKALVEETERVFQALGIVSYGPSERERKSLVFRRSIYIVRDMKAGEVFTTANVRIIRPGLGLPPREFDHIVGKRIGRDVRRGTPLTWDLVG
jgi:pseudaminic acid synthase